MKILGVNISHHPTICWYENGEIKKFFNEERFVNIKHHDAAKCEIFLSIFQHITDKPDIVCYSSYGRNVNYCDVTDQDLINKIQKQLKNSIFFFNEKEHHLYHAICGFYFSEFNEAAVIVVDGGGACNAHIPYQETESIYFIDKKNIFPFFKHHNSNRSCNLLNFTNVPEFQFYNFYNGYINKFSNEKNGGHLFNEGCVQIGYKDGNDSGKLMGLSSYAYTNIKYDLDYEKVEIAKKIQEISFNNTCKLIDIAKEKSKNIILSGGCALNCSNNFKYVKKYPKLNFFVDPIPHDAGTAIGVAIYYDNYKK